MIMVHIPEQMLRSGFDAVHAIPALGCRLVAHAWCCAGPAQPGRARSPAGCGEVARLTCVGPMAPGYGLPPLSL